MQLQLQFQILDKLDQIQIVLPYSGSNYVGLFGLGDLPQGMGWDKFEKFFTKCYSQTPDYMIEYKVSQDSVNLEVNLIASLEFFNISHNLKFVKAVCNPKITIQLIENINKNLESKLDKTITLVDLRSFEPIDLKSQDNLSNMSKHKIEYDLSDRINSTNTNLLVGYKSSVTKLDLSAYPYEMVKFTQLDNFYNLEELIINGQSGYKFFSADSNQIDGSIFIKDIISIGTINPNVKKVTINNIYRVEGTLGHMDWAPELEELTLIGVKGSVKIVKFIKRNTKLKKINLINCVIGLPKPIGKPDPSKPVYREDSVVPKTRPNFKISSSTPILWNDSSYRNCYDYEQAHKEEYERLYSTSIDSLRGDNKFKPIDEITELVKWCESKSIEITVGGYVNDKETNKDDFPFMERKNKFSSAQNNDFDSRKDQMTRMDSSGLASYPNIYEEFVEMLGTTEQTTLSKPPVINLDLVKANDPKEFVFASA